MIERLRHECITCLMSNLYKVPEGVSDEERLKYMQRVLEVLAHADKSFSGPVIVRKIYDIQKEMFGMETDYRDVKLYFNDYVLKREEYIQSRIKQSDEPLKLAVHFAMIGNYIDFGALNNVSEEMLTEFIDNASAEKIDDKVFNEFADDMEKADNIVYLTDNCGEIVFDKVLIKEIKDKYSNKHITVLVKGGPVLNDATMEDAIQVGLTDMVQVSDNDNNIAGTCLEALSPEAMEILNNADLIISKGQANYETLRKCGMNIYYIFMCKCDMFAGEFNVPKYTGMLVRERA